MRLEKLTLHNWQSYKGRALNAKSFDFRGKSGKKNAIIYGQNTRGKTAIWEAIRFGLYGRVAKRKTHQRFEDYKPIIANTSDKQPLLNVESYEKGDCIVGVDIWFDHEGNKYKLERYYEPRRGIARAHKDSHMEPHVILRNETESKYEKDADEFINKILPENLIRFFMFDGERLEEYRTLMEARDDIELRSYIEGILRLPILTSGIEDFEELKRKVQKNIRRYATRLTKDEASKKAIVKMEEEIKDLQDANDRMNTSLETFRAEEDEIRNWLLENDKGKQIVEQEERFTEQVETHKEIIKATKDKMHRTMPDSWRTILTPKIRTQIEYLRDEIKRQSGERETIGQLKGVVNSLQEEIAGKPCSICSAPRKKLSQRKLIEKENKLVGVESQIKELESSTIDPDPTAMASKLVNLTNFLMPANLDSLVELETELLTQRRKRREAEQKLKIARTSLSAESRREVAEKTNRWERLLAKIGSLTDEIKGCDGIIAEKRNTLNTKTAGLVTKGQKTTAHEKAEIEDKILDGLIDIWTEAKEKYRESMRSRVEKHASHVFMECTNNRENYKGLIITKEFVIHIVNKRGQSDLGSPGQWAVIAYSMLDALTSCSGIEFPMVIDTPGRSVDDEHLRNIFEHFFNTGKQIIFLPEGKELIPDDGDRDYGHLCAATYQLNKDNKDRTEIITRIDNLENLNG